MNRILFAGIVAALTASIAVGQSERQGPAFDAVSIRSSAIDTRGGGFNLSPGRLNAKNRSLKDLVQFAWNLHDYQLSGGPNWAETDRFEVTATFPGATTNDQRSQMMQAMLAERFGVTVRRESKEISGYALVSGRNGAKLHTAQPGEHGMMLGRSAASGQRTLTGRNATLSELASMLADLLDRPVRDETGLAGNFDFTLEWTPDSVSGGSGAPGGKQVVADDAQPGPSIFTALQETLGLKLETKKVPVDTIVIERAGKPTAN